MAKPFISLVIPVSHASENLPLELIELDRVFSQAEFSYEVIVVDDGSEDKTSEIAKKIGEALKNVKVIDNIGKRGIGTAAVIGMLSGKGNWRVLIERLEGLRWSELYEMLLQVRRDAERDVLVFSKAFSFLPRMLHVIDRAFLKILFKSQIKEMHPWALCVASEAVEDIFPALKTKGESAFIESLLIAERMRYRLVPKFFSGISDTASFPEHYLQTLAETIKIRWWFSRNKYTI